MPKINIKLRPWAIPDFVTVEEPPSPRELGFKPSTQIKISDLPHETIREIAQQWLNELYSKAGMNEKPVLLRPGENISPDW